MNLRKRTLALLLTVCLLLSLTVPMVSAAALVNHSLTASGANLDAEKIEFIPELDGTNFKWSSSTRKMPSLAFSAESPIFSIRFNTNNAGESFEPGDYRLTVKFYSTDARTGCPVAVYVLPNITGKTGDALTNEIAKMVEDDTYFAGVFDSRGDQYQATAQFHLNGGPFILAFKALDYGTKFVPQVFYMLSAMTCGDAAGLMDCLTTADNAKMSYAIKLDGDVDAGDEAITIPANVSLDLNGHTLTASNITINGKVADSSEAGNGMVVTNIATAGENLTYKKYDAANPAGIDVVVPYTIAPYGSELQYINNNTMKLWIELKFENPEAYRVLAAGNSGIEIGAALNWAPTGDTAKSANLIFPDSVVAEWGTKMAAGGNYGLTIQFTGFETLAAGTLTLTPMVNSVNSAESVEFVK